MRLLLDTNVLFSGLGFRGVAGQLLETIIRQGHTLVAADYILEELRRRIRDKFQGHQKEEALDLLLLLLSRTPLQVKEKNEYQPPIKKAPTSLFGQPAPGIQAFRYVIEYLGTAITIPVAAQFPSNPGRVLGWIFWPSGSSPFFPSSSFFAMNAARKTRGIKRDISMRCLSCGFENPEEMKFCGRCGTKLANRVLPPNIVNTSWSGRDAQPTGGTGVPACPRQSLNVYSMSGGTTKTCTATDHSEHLETPDSSFAKSILFGSQPKSYNAFRVLGSDTKRGKNSKKMCSMFGGSTLIRTTDGAHRNQKLLDENGGEIS